ncbi:MAG: HAD family hydrolase [Lachnospiraceae bacterium]
MIEYQGAIFDLDGTLLDSMKVWEEIDIEFLGNRGVRVPPEYIAAITPMTFQEAAAYTIRRFGFEERPDDLIREWNTMAKEKYATQIPLKANARNYLTYLKAQGIRLAVATALPQELYVPALANNGITSLFDAYANVNEVAHGKGYPDVYLLAAERLCLSASECMVFEDIYEAIQGAKAGGFCTIGVYDDAAASDWEQILKSADRCIRDFAELMTEK